jgi:phosphoglycolate phosphatase-like HAD superfamily hydrolase
MGIIFDLDQTLIDSSLAESYRKPGGWSSVYPLIPKFTAYEGITSVMDYLKANSIPYVIVTSSPSVYCTKVCDHWLFKPAYIIGYHDTSKRKPFPDPILLALTKLSLKPDKALSFGDRDIDITASNAASVKSIACLWGANDKETLIAAKPSLTINNPIEMIDIIKAHLIH